MLEVRTSTKEDRLLRLLAALTALVDAELDKVVVAVSATPTRVATLAMETTLADTELLSLVTLEATPETAPDSEVALLSITVLAATIEEIDSSWNAVSLLTC